MYIIFIKLLQTEIEYETIAKNNVSENDIRFELHNYIICRSVNRILLTEGMEY